MQKFEGLTVSFRFILPILMAAFMYNYSADQNRLHAEERAVQDGAGTGVTDQISQMAYRVLYSTKQAHATPCDPMQLLRPHPKVRSSTHSKVEEARKRLGLTSSEAQVFVKVHRRGGSDEG